MMKKLLLFTFFMTPFLHQAQVSLVKDISPSGNSNPKFFTEMNNVLYFQAANNASGDDFELWRTDGTTAGTYLVKDLRAAGSSDPKGFKVFNNELYFVAQNSATTSNLYKSDGTDIGTVVFQTSAVTIQPYFSILNNKLYYARNIPSTRALMSFDGLTETQLLLSPTVRYLVPYTSANKIIFQSDGSNNTDWEIWQSDGTVAGTYELADLFGGDNLGSDAKQFFEVNGKVFFTAFGASNVGRELYITDGTTSGTVLVKNINPTNSGGNAANSNPDNFTLFNNKLYFTANDATNGDELWVSDGTETGTQMVIDLYPGATGSNPSDLFVFNNALYFAADHPTLGREVFKCTTTNTVTNLKNISSGLGSSNPSNFTEYNGKLYFVAEDPVNGRELWNSTGFNSTTNLLADINSGIGSSNPSNLAVMGTNLFFSADDGVSGTGIELYKYQDPSLSVNDVELENSISLFPNPTNNSFNIKTNKTIQSIIIYDIQGKTVKSFDAEMDSYSIQELNSGLYYLRIKSDKGEVTKKLVKK